MPDVRDLRDYDICEAEMVDGSYTYCGCADCDQREREDLEWVADHG